MYRIQYSQKLPLTLDKAWDFFSTPTNLKMLTPQHMGFEIQNPQDMRKMYAGQVISYTLYPLWSIPVNWVTEITHVEEGSYFIDQQRFGPYKYWHHEHRFTAIAKGVEMVDTVYYKIPFGPLGKAFHALKIGKDIEAIFTYRHDALEKAFGSYNL